MLLNELFEISANPDYLRAAERSRSQARDTQRQYWKSPEEKAAARRTELKRDAGIAGYTKRHRAANPDAYPTPKAQPAPKLRDPSTEYSDDYSVWAAGRRDTMEQGVAEGSLNEGQYEMMMRNGQVKKFVAKDDADAKRIAAGHGAKSVIRLRGGVPAGKVSEQGVAEGYNDISVGDYVSYDDGPGTDRWEVVSIEGNRVELRNDQGGTTFADINDVLKEQGVAEGLDAEAYKEKLLATLPQMLRFYEKNVKGWKPSEEQMLAAVETGYTVMKHTGDVKQAGKAVMDELNTLHRMSQGQQGVAEGSKKQVKPKYEVRVTPTTGMFHIHDAETGKRVAKDVAYTRMKAYEKLEQWNKKQGVAEGRTK